MKRIIYCCYALVKSHQGHVIIYFLILFFNFRSTGCHLLSISLNLDVTLIFNFIMCPSINQDSSNAPIIWNFDSHQ